MSQLCVTATVCDCAIATEVRAPHTAFTAVRFRPLLGLREGGGGLLLRSNVVTSQGCQPTSLLETHGIISNSLPLSFN